MKVRTESFKKIEKDYKEWFLKTCWPNSFSRFTFVVSNVWYNAGDTRSCDFAIYK